MTLKFLCLNLWCGGKLLEPLHAFLRQERPDVLAAQEVCESDDPTAPPNFRSSETLTRVLRHPHYSFSPAFRDLRPEGACENGNAVFSRFPIRETHAVFYDVPYNSARRETNDSSDTPRNLQHAVIDVDGRTTVNVFNTQGVWGFDGEDNSRRLAMSETIVREITGKPRVILAGDFNVREGTQTIAAIERRLTNVFKGERRTSFNMQHKTGGGFATAVVDFVFVSSDIRVLSHEAPDADVSDHQPLVCEFEVS